MKIKKIRPRYSVNAVIISVSIFLTILLAAVSLYLLEEYSEQFWSSFLLNLSASLMTVAITVVLVDILRELHNKKQRLPAQSDAMQQIRSAHMALFMLLAFRIYPNNKELQGELAAAGNKQNEGDYTALSLVYEKYFTKMVEMTDTDVLARFNDFELNTDLKNIILKLHDEIHLIDSKYRFAFPNIEFNTEFTKLKESLLAVTQSFNMFEFDMKEVNRFFLRNQNASEKTISNRTMLEMCLQNYLNRYTSFVEKHSFTLK
jgi:hypothetical protein